MYTRGGDSLHADLCTGPLVASTPLIRRRWQGHKETGVMLKCIQFIKVERPKSFLLENVLGFSDAPESQCSPLAFVIAELTAAGYNVHAITLGTEAWINCSRLRPDCRAEKYVYLCHI